jgi:hypothetical protein
MAVVSVFLGLCIANKSSGQSGPPPLPTLPAGQILDVWEFQDSNWLSAFGDVPLSFTNISLTADWAGNGLLMDSTDPATLNYAVIGPDGWTNITFDNGTISMWFSPDWSSGDGPGNWGTLLEAGSWNTNLATATGAIGLFISPDGTSLFWSAQTNGYSTNYLSAPISWNAGDFHEITVTYSVTNSSLFLEGQFVTNGPGITVLPSASVLSNGFSIGSDGNSTGFLQSRGVYNAIFTYDYTLDAATISNNYAYESQNVYPLPTSGGFHRNDDGPPSPPTGTNSDGGGSTNTYYTPIYSTNQFWVETVGYGTNFYNSDSNALTLIVHGTTQNIPFQIQSETNLSSSNWITEGTFVGSADTYFTVVNLSMVGRSNTFFRVLNNSLDTAQIGIPDWWQLKYFGYVGIDPNGNSTGDGYSNLYKYLNGMNPNIFYQPQAPTGFFATLNTNGTSAVLNWNPSPGNVQSYTIYVQDDQSYEGFLALTNLSADQNSFTDNSSVFSDGIQYLMQANYLSTNSILSDQTDPAVGQTFLAYTIQAKLVRGAFGRWQLAFPTLLTNIQSILITWNQINYYGNDYGIFSEGYSQQNVSLTNLVNGCYVIPDGEATNYLGDTIFVQGVGPEGKLGISTAAGILPGDAPYFVDGRQCLEEVLAFTLREASRFHQINYYYDGGISSWCLPGDTNYSAASFIHPDLFNNYGGDSTAAMTLDDRWPVVIDYQLASLLFSTYPVPSFSWTNNFQASPVPPILAPGGPFQSGPYWIVNYKNEPDSYSGNFNLNDWGFETNGTTSISLLDSLNNVYGLTMGNALVVGYAGEFGPLFTNVLDLGSSASLSGNPLDEAWSQTAVPSLTTVDYYFAPVVCEQGAIYDYSAKSIQQNYPVPLTFDPSTQSNYAAEYANLPTNLFSSTNQTPVILASVGQPILIGGWAKQSLGNGYSNVFGYLGQYFDTNSAMLSNGYLYTNISAGIVSPYGEFLPTRAGTAVLTTLPNYGQTNVGQVQINVLKICLDASHNENSGSNLDLTFYGPDITSSNAPFVFWLNNNFDRSNLVDCTLGYFDCDEEVDDVMSGDCPLASGISTPDCDYQVSLYGYAIPTARDLEDYTRLWIPGLASLYQSNTNLTFQLIVRNNDTSDGPAINLFQAVETNGGSAYLTNETVAQEQIAYPTLRSVGRVGPYNTINLNSYFALAGTASDYFIWCGARRGKGELVLQVLNGTNLIAETSTWIQLKDIREMFERYTVGDTPFQTPYSTAIRAGEDLPSGVGTFKYDAPTDANTPYILFVHGWNMTQPEKDQFAYTAYKRLYWQGYTGRFGSFRWPTGYNFLGEISDQALSLDNFDTSEFAAWSSGAPLRKLLVKLGAEYPNNLQLIAHSMVNIAAGEALRTNTTLVQTYIAMQAAVPSHAYDPTTPTRSLGIFDQGDPERTAEYYTNGAPCYFNEAAGAANYFNFYNTNDYALLKWQTDQDAKPLPPYFYAVPVGSENYGMYVGTLTTNVYYNFPADTFNIFAHIIQGRCYTVGAQPNVGGAFKVGATFQQIDLGQPPYSFQASHKYHSAEFRSDNESRAAFWNNVLQQMNLLDSEP